MEERKHCARVFAPILLLALSAGPALAKAAPEQPVIYDNDWSVTDGGYVAQPSLMPLLTSPSHRLLALTTVSGDFWRDEGTVSVLRFLEVVGVGALPVARGAAFPLVNSAERHRLWQQRFGAIPWSGSWNTPSVQADAHPDDPWAIIPPRESMPRLAASAMTASAALIAAVHAQPHQVTIYAEGPLTNIALAIRLDPEFSSLAKGIVIQGSNAASDHDDGSRPAEFNILYDPEAADIVLRAPWAQLLLIGEAANRTLMTPALLERIKAIDTPAARYAAANAGIDMPLWSELGSAIMVDPAIVTSSVQAVVQVDLSHGATYGRTRTWPVGSDQVPERGWTRQGS
jgi:inosine-uridine nucleoside N-ribohydrolase